MADHEVLAWRHDTAGLALVIGRDPAPVAVPEVIAEWLIGPSGIDTTASPGADLLALEGQLRVMAAELEIEVDRAERRVRDARITFAAAAGLWWSWAARRAWTKHEAELDAAIASHGVLVSAYTTARETQAELRQYVIGLDRPSGLLAEAARGWRRSPEAPPSVVRFDDEDQFVLGNVRRASELGYPVIGGDVLGHGWRRDHDEDDPDSRPLERIGPWTVGYIPRTGELYATRRSAFVPSQVWLLGSGIPAQQAYALHDEIGDCRREPNSLILLAHEAAQVVRRDRLAELEAVAHQTGPPPPPRTAGTDVVLGEHSDTRPSR